MPMSGGWQIFEYQVPVTLNQAAPVQNTWYTILDTTPNVRVYGATVNVEDTNETLELRATVDGEVIPPLAVGTVHSTSYHAQRQPDAITMLDQISLTTDIAHSIAVRAFLLEGHSVKIELRKTTATGVGNLTGIVVYGVLTNA